MELEKLECFTEDSSKIISTVLWSIWHLRSCFNVFYISSNNLSCLNRVKRKHHIFEKSFWTGKLVFSSKMFESNFYKKIMISFFFKGLVSVKTKISLFLFYMKFQKIKSTSRINKLGPYWNKSSRGIRELY